MGERQKNEITHLKTGYGGSSRYSLRETEVPASSLHPGFTCGEPVFTQVLETYK